MRLRKIVTLLSSSLVLFSVGGGFNNLAASASASSKVKKESAVKKGLPASFTTRTWGGGEEQADPQYVKSLNYNSATTTFVSSLYKTTVANQYAYITFGDNDQHKVVDDRNFSTFNLLYSKKLGDNHYLLLSNKNGKGTVINYHYYEPNTANFSGTINSSYKFNVQFKGYDSSQLNEYRTAMGEPQQ